MLATTKPKKCKACGTSFTPSRPLARACSAMCALAIGRMQTQKAQAAKAKDDKAQDKVKREKLKSNGQRKAEAQAALNRWIVHGRDAHEPCISCGRFHEGIYHAGHYRSRGSAPHLALDERNLAKQCAPCNLYLHGNLIQYRAGLIRRHGLAFVEALESDSTPRHYTGADYDAIKASARERLREHKKGQS